MPAIKKKTQTNFREKLQKCYEETEAPDDLWLKAIARIFKGKADVWYETNDEDFTSWKKFKQMFREQYLGLQDEDDLYDDLRRKIQSKQESISEYIDRFRHMISRLRRPPADSEQLKIIYKGLLLE